MARPLKKITFFAVSLTKSDLQVARISGLDPAGTLRAAEPDPPFSPDPALIISQFLNIDLDRKEGKLIYLTYAFKYVDHLDHFSNCTASSRSLIFALYIRVYRIIL